MSFFVKHRIKIIAAAAIAAILTAAFLWGGNTPDTRKPDSALVKVSQEPGKEEETTALYEVSLEPSPEASPDASPYVSDIPVKKPTETAAAENRPQGRDSKPLTAEEKTALADRIAAEMSAEPDIRTAETPTEPSHAEPAENESYSFYSEAANKPAPESSENGEMYCTLSVKCDTILDNMAWLNPEKNELVPADGVILEETKAVFYEGESVFNLLLREMKKNRIHMEFENTPIYQSAYISGINNLYEYDCGELSGWMYRVNGIFPNYGCSKYKLHEGDRVEFLYTCNLGIDVGGYNPENNSNE